MHGLFATGLPARRIRCSGASQRLLTFGGSLRTHAAWHRVVVGARDRRLLEWLLYEELQSQDARGAVHLVPESALLHLEVTVITCPRSAEADTSILCSHAPFSMTSPDAMRMRSKARHDRASFATESSPS